MDTPNVFCIIGHGCDLASEVDPVTGKRPTVPPGCKYITLEICGRGGWELPKLYSAFSNPTLCIPLMFPEIPELVAILQNYIGHSGASSITVHNEGDSYTDATSTYLADTSPIYWKSGLYRLSTTHTLANGKFFFDASREAVNMDDLYAYSLITPVPGRVLPKISDLMKMQPGIYYNFACRGPCTEANIPHIPLVRRKSFEQKVAKDPTFARYSPNLDSVYNSMSLPKGKENAIMTYTGVDSETAIWNALLQEFRDWYSSAEQTSKQYLRIKHLLPIIHAMIANPYYLHHIPFGFQPLYNYFYTHANKFTEPDVAYICDALDNLATHILPMHLRRIRGVPVYGPRVTGGHKKNKTRRKKRSKFTSLKVESLVV